MSDLDSNQYPSTAISGQYAYTDTLAGIYYGPGSVTTALPALIATLNVHKALIVTGRSLHDKVRT